MNQFRAIVAGIVCAACIVVHAQAGLTGKWQGATATGRPVVLDLKAEKQQLTGKLTVGPQSADIAEGKIEDKTFSFKATIENRTVTCRGRLVDEAVELTVEGVADPVTLKRVK